MTDLPSVKEPEPEYLAQVGQSPWDNVYWFARMFIASDKYGGVGGEKQTMLTLVFAIRTAQASLQEENEEAQVTILMETVRNILLKRWGHTRKRPAVEALGRDDSPRYLSASQHSGMCAYVRPISRFVSDLRSEVG